MEMENSLVEIRTVQAISSRGGHHFEPVQERDLYSLAAKAAQTLPGAKGGVVLVSEMPGPLGQPDFVVLLGGNDWISKRRSAGVGPQLGQAECTVLAALYEKRPLKLETLSRRLDWSVESLQPILSKLVRQGAVDITSTGSYRLVSGMMPSGHLVAFEAKVKDWHRAIVQGRAYRTWADNYVVLLGEVGETAMGRAIEAVADDGAGLFNETGWSVYPKPRKAVAARRLWGFEYLLAAVGGLDPSF